MSTARASSLGFDTLRLEGALLLPDVLEKAVQGKASGQTDADYHVPRGYTPQEEIGRAFRIAQAQWKVFSGAFERTDLDAAITTRAFVEEFLRDALGYVELDATPPVEVGERRFPIAAFAAPGIPLVIAPHGLDLDEPDAAFAPLGGGARRKSPFQLLQEFLNAAPDCRWGLATNGRRVRLARDTATLTRPSFLEFDLEAVLAETRYPDFAALWRLLHASRAGRKTVEVAQPIWETWRADGQREGARVREGLRTGVEAALLRLGEGFLQHPENEPLRRDLISGDLTRKDYFEELLRLVYRFIFLFAVEERGLLHPVDDSPEAAAARRIYDEGYSTRRLRSRCLRRVALDTYDDLWRAQLIVFRALATGEPRLALPALGGLFSPAQCPHLDRAPLSNRALLEAMRHLRWAVTGGTFAPVDYRNMGPEELGSVYESLLELEAEPDPLARSFAFAGTDGDTKGNARKLSGSYYTPDSLVQELIKSALDPVIEARVAAHPDHPTEALLGITVVDPACGSGHFLLAAARRLAERLAALRSPEGAVRARDYRHALREVITHCVYGVDRNPMALELARFALWLEGYEEGLPLGFLDHHLVCGDALLGITDVTQLMHGIPDAAFKPLSGDDKTLCRTIVKENKEGLKAFAKRKDAKNLSFMLEHDALLAERAALEAMPDDHPQTQAAKEAAYETYRKLEHNSRLKQAADLFMGAFLAPKATPEAIDNTPTSQNLYFALFTDRAPTELAQVNQAERLARATQLANEARVLHWPLAFLPVFQKGGFDCVLGNPPWEVSQLGEIEYFATRAPEIAKLSGEARKRAISMLAESDERLWNEYLAKRRQYDATNIFFREGNRFPLTALGKLNTYPLFAETIGQVLDHSGRAGFIVPTGIATDDGTKEYFSSITRSGRLVSLYDFRTGPGLFSEIGHQRYKFCLLTLGASVSTDLLFFALRVEDLSDERRHFKLTTADYQLLNPNTLTCPVFRSQKDAELTKTIYAHVPVLIREARGRAPELNAWGIRFMQGLFNMTSDSGVFEKQSASDRLPLYEAKMIHQFDHRWATYRKDAGADVSDDVPLADKQNPTYTVQPRYWVDSREVKLRTAELPKGLLSALRERNTPVIVLAVAHLLFAHWVKQRYPTPDAALKNLFSTWRAFLKAQPFANALAPTQLGLAGNNPACLKPLGPDYLPAAPVDRIVATARESTAWYAADPCAVTALMAMSDSFPIAIDGTVTLVDQAAAIAFAEELLEQATPKWFVGFRDIARATDERTVIASVLPRAGVGHTTPLITVQIDLHRTSALVGNLNSLVLDFVARQKVGGTHLTYTYLKQLAVLPPDAYSNVDLAFIVPRVLELTYTAHDLLPWAKALGHDEPPFRFEPDRRARLRAELDAYYALLYSLTREDLCYILDPVTVMGEDYPSETFRVLKQNEEREFGEYRTQRLVLEAWDKLHNGELHSC